MTKGPLLAIAFACVCSVFLGGCAIDKAMCEAISQGIADIGPRGGLFVCEARVDDAPHRYALFVPPSAQDHAGEPGLPMPCIVFLHGRGECGTDGLKQCTVGLVAAAMLNAQTAAAGGGWGDFLIVAPQKPIENDTWEQHEKLVLTCLRYAQSLASLSGRPIDPTRTYLTGLSQGGAGTWAIASRHPDLFAAIAPVCGFVHTPGKNQNSGDADQRQRIAAALAAAKTPVWAFHGEQDDVVKPQQTRLMIDELAAKGWSEEVRATYYPDANHYSWDPAYRTDGAALARWFLAHKRQVGHPGSP